MKPTKFLAFLLCAFLVGLQPVNAVDKPTPEQLQKFHGECIKTLKDLKNGVPPPEARHKGWNRLTTEILWETLATTDSDTTLFSSFLKHVLRRQPWLMANVTIPKRLKAFAYTGWSTSGPITIIKRKIKFSCEVRDYGDGPFLLRVYFQREGTNDSIFVPINPKPF